MKNKKMNRIVSLLLAAVMILALAFTLVSCKEEEDAPVTAEAKLSNFVTFDTDDRKELNNVTDLTKDLGKYDSTLGYEFDDYVLFKKIDKNAMNILTETYSLYSLKENKVTFTVSNSYADEFV